MRHYQTISFIIILNLWVYQSGFAQKNSTYTLYSKHLGDSIKVLVAYPENYLPTNPYPVIYVPWRPFYPAYYNLTSTISHYKGWIGNIPESIVIGIDFGDGGIGLSYETGELDQLSLSYVGFLKDELFTLVKETIAPKSSFRIWLGHSYTANYGLYHFTGEDSPFDACIGIAPEKGEYRISFSKIKDREKPSFLYIATGGIDEKSRILLGREIASDATKKGLGRNNLFFELDYFKDKGHNDIVPFAIDNGLSSVFSAYITADKLEKMLEKGENALAIFEKANRQNLLYYGITLQKDAGNAVKLINLLKQEKDTVGFNILADFFLLQENPSANLLEILSGFYIDFGIYGQAENCARKSIEKYVQEGDLSGTFMPFKYLIMDIYGKKYKDRDRTMDWISKQYSTIKDEKINHYYKGYYTATFGSNLEGGINSLKEYVRDPDQFSFATEGAYFLLAKCYLWKNDNEEALNALNKALEINPDYRKAQELKDELLKEKKRKE